MSRYRHRDKPLEYHVPLACRLWGHSTWEPDGYYCLRCNIPCDAWPPYTNGGIFQIAYHALCWPVERWWRMRQPSQRWPFHTICDDCGKVDRIWTRAVGEHEHCDPIPF